LKLADFIFTKINVVAPDVIEPYKEKTIEIMKDIDIANSPLLALTMALNCPIWSNNGHFKKHNMVTVYTTNEFMKLLKI